MSRIIKDRASEGEIVSFGGVEGISKDADLFEGQS